MFLGPVGDGIHGRADVHPQMTDGLDLDTT
jgi:hypothetical protein